MHAPDFNRRLAEARQLLLAQNFTPALRKYEALTRLFPGKAIVWLEYGNAAAGIKDRQLAHLAWQKALGLEPLNAEMISLVGHQYQALRQPVDATACFQRAAAVDPRALNARISLAVLLEQNHRLEEARAAVQQCLAIDARDEQAHYFMAVLDRRENRLESAERRLRDLVAREPRHPYVRYASRYELAQVLDRTERYDEAMEFLAQAKRLVRALVDTRQLLKSYDESAESARRFTGGLPKNVLSQWAADFPEDRRETILRLAFLGGHPRSGTTLLEQVLDAHPEVAALDEPSAFLETLQPEFYRSRELSATRLNFLRRRYVDALLDETGPAGLGKLLLDKNPSPTARLPLWLKVLPELRVIIAIRDPRDVALSCYFQNIPLNSVNVNFLSLERTAKHYADLMDIWLMVREWEGFLWLESRYEDTVAALEKEGRRVTSFLGLVWHEDQARFHEKSLRKQLYSPTYQDVTRPVYSRSVARWQFYAKHLAPILPALKPYCQNLRYDP